MGYLARAKIALFVVTAGVALAGCTSQGSSTGTVSAPLRLGPSGRQFDASFPRNPSAQTFRLSGAKRAQYGVGVLTNTVFSSRGDGPPEMDVWVESLTNTVAARHVIPFLRSYLSAPSAGRVTKWSGGPAIEESLPGCDPSGTCVGTIGNLVVLRGTTLYFVFTHQSDQTAARQALHSFRIVG